MGKKLWIVDLGGSGDYTSIQEALDAASQTAGGVIILVKEGIYFENLTVKKADLTLVGEPGKNVSVVNDGSNGSAEPAALLVEGDGFSAENLIFVSSAEGEGACSKAVAAYIRADRVQFHHCGFLGHQDTVVATGGFLQELPKNTPQSMSRQYFRCCYFEGSGNVLAGNATALFECCKLHSLNPTLEAVGCVAKTAAPLGADRGFTFKSCLFTGDGPKQATYLGSGFSSSFMDCWMGGHIHPEVSEQMVKECWVLDGDGQLSDRPWGLTHSKGTLLDATLEGVFGDASWCVGRGGNVSSSTKAS
ncbi:MAG: pectinesterase family protein [Turicibacter sp.]|nr:pectinesterase family protein [Turicibacter sp.]